MKMSDSLKRAEANMQPGVILPSGFLGSDNRPLADIIAADEVAMKHLGLDWDELARRLRHFLEAGMAGLGETVEIDGGWQVQADETRGKIASPWEDGLCRKVNVTLSRPPHGRMVYNELNIFLLERHHFLEGRGSSFRIEPEKAKALLF